LFGESGQDVGQSLNERDSQSVGDLGVPLLEIVLVY
jgi:hypothetical protein